MSKKQQRTQGMNWIRKDKRLAIYLRDGMACVYCGSTLEDGITLTLDHIIPYSQNGSNRADNLVTCCRRCNSSRNDRDVSEFAHAVAEYINHGVSGEMILDFIQETTRRKLTPFRQRAKEIINLRSSWSKALETAAA